MPVEPTPISTNQIAACGRLFMTQTEIGELYGLSQPQISARLKEDDELRLAYLRGKAQGKRSLRRAQKKSAENGNVTAQIWLGKQYLEQTDKVETHDTHDVNIKFIAQWGKTPQQIGSSVNSDPDLVADSEGTNYSDSTDFGPQTSAQAGDDPIIDLEATEDSLD